MENSKIFGTTEYDKILADAIPALSTFDKLAGGEGVAYFLNDKFVVKEFLNLENSNVLNIAFDAYSKEMKNFKKMGYSVPEIYSWVRVPVKSKNRREMDKFFILEERVVGRELYFGFIEDVYSLVKNLCSKKEFYSAVDRPDENIELFSMIATEYIRDYIQMNEFIEALPEDVLEKFIIEAFNMYVIGRVSAPDIFPSNILVDGHKLTIIDNKIADRDGLDEEYMATDSDGFDDIETAHNFIISNLLNLFIYNEYISDYNNGLLYSLEDKDAVKVDNLVRQNVKVCEAAILKIVKVMNNCLDNPALTNKNLFKNTFNMLVRVLGTDKAERVMKQVSSKFEM